MVNIYIAYTAPINPVGLTPLTTSQVWKGLQRKARKAQEFVPAIVECEVLEENEGGREIKRQVKFKGDEGTWVKERCVEYEPTKVDFHQENGSTISNVISEGKDGELYMTYVFEWLHPDVKEGSKEAGELKGKHNAIAKMAVEKSIESIRKMVGDGVL